jgi:hypothetical protein
LEYPWSCSARPDGPLACRRMGFKSWPCFLQASTRQGRWRDRVPSCTPTSGSRRWPWVCRGHWTPVNKAMFTGDDDYAATPDLRIARQLEVISLRPGGSPLVPICPGRTAWGFGVGSQRDSAERLGIQLLGQSWDKSAIAALSFWPLLRSSKGCARAAAGPARLGPRLMTRPWDDV